MPTLHIVLVPMFTALTIIGSLIKIPIPISPIPLTLQVLFVILSGALLGSKLGAISQLLYAILGLIGLPVFAQGGGISYILKPSFGYIIGFIISSYLIGKIIEYRKKKNLFTFLLANLVGIIIIYIIGVIYMFLIINFVTLTPISIYQAVIIGALPFIFKELILVVFVTIIAHKVFHQISNYRSNI
jgi:biotin transport system substrate-specific component